MKRIAQLAILFFPALPFVTGCHAQAPPASPGYNVNLAWGAPQATAGWTGCAGVAGSAAGAAQCTYAVYAETLASGSTCDPYTSANFKEITNPASRPVTTSFVDTNSTGLDECYLVETVQTSANSGPSNIVNLIVPGVPLAPSLSAPTAAQAALELSPKASPAAALCRSCATPLIPRLTLTARLERPRGVWTR